MLVYPLNSSGVKKGPRKLPSVDSTTVSAWFPWPWPVITTLEEMVVATQPVKIMPTSSPGSMKFLLDAAALTSANMNKDVMKKD